MNQDAERLILGDAVAAASEEGVRRRRRWFGRKRTARPLTNCENCGAPLAGPYCAKCGQHAIDYRRSFGRVFLDVLDSFLNWDSKFFDTIALLLARPWQLTNAFVAGQRVRYVHPLRLYLIVSIGFFFGVHELAKTMHFDNKPAELTPEKRAKLEQRMTKLPPEAQEELRKAMNEPAKKRQFLHFGSSDKPQTPFEQWMSDRAKTKIGEDGLNAKVFFLTLVSNLPAMMLCCIPVFAFLLKILYIRKHVLYIDHLIYALHIHAFAYLAIMIIGFGGAGVARLAPDLAGWFRAALIVAAIVLVLISIRRVYRQGWFMTVVKFLFGGFCYFLVLIFGLVATLFVTLALPE